MNKRNFILPAILLFGAGGCVDRHSDTDQPAAVSYVRPDGRIFTPPDTRPNSPPSPVTQSAAADRYGIVDSIQAAATHVDDPNAIPGGPDATPVNASAGNPLPGNAQATGEIAKEREQARERYQIRVRFPDGSYRTVFRENLDGLQVGDRIRVGAEGVAPN